MKNVCGILIAAATLLDCGSAVASAAERPNIVWLVSEDNSKHYLRLFDEHGAATPNIEKLAAEGLAFEHAFSCSPVCSVARTTLATSVYAPRLGTQFHRQIKPATLPDGWQIFPAYLRETGYYTTNNSKTDYNTDSAKGVWDESSNRASWRNRPSDDTPFFHMQSYANSHESSLHFSERQMQSPTGTDPADVTLAPIHPDTKIFRYTHARYHDRMREIDNIVGRVIEQLTDDGLLEDTFVFYFGDHGGVLPGSKGYIYERGVHVPLVVRIPEKWKQLVDAQRGTRVGGFVSFVDFGPTVLNLAGVPVPEFVDGRAFLGDGVSMAEVNSRDEAFSYADRFDEKYDQCRSLRKGRFKYLRNYQAFYPDALQNNYRYQMLAYQQWRELYRDGKLNAAQSLFFERKPAEALYDIETDPYETKNLADDPQYAEVLAKLRGRLAEWVKGLPDLSFYPESVLVEQAVDQPIEFGRSHAGEIAALVDVADLQLLPFATARPKLEAALASNDPWKRYWALIDCSVFGGDARPLADAARALLDDPELLVRMRAAEFLGSIRAADPRPTMLEILQQAESPVVNLLTLNAVVYLRDHHGYDFELNADQVAVKNGEVGRRLEYLAE